MATPSQGISNAVVGLFRERFGRGPTKAKAHIVDGLVVCVLREVMTSEDRSLIEAGREDLLQEKRVAIQRDAREALERAVERHVEGKVIAMLSDMDAANDIAILNFVVEGGSEE